MVIMIHFIIQRGAALTVSHIIIHTPDIIIIPTTLIITIHTTIILRTSFQTDMETPADIKQEIIMAAEVLMAQERGSEQAMEATAALTKLQQQTTQAGYIELAALKEEALTLTVTEQEQVKALTAGVRTETT